MPSEERSFSEMAAAMVRAAVADVLETEAAALADAPDGVHRHRTRVRRLRGILAMLRRDLPPETTDRVRVQLREWGTQLGTVRDAEVLVAEAEASLTEAEVDDEALRRRLIERPAAEYAARHARLVRLHQQPRARARTSELHAFAAGIAPSERGAGAFADILGREARRVRKAAKRLDGSLDRLHDVRKAGRRLRYAAEAVVAEGPPDLADAAKAAAKAGSHLHDVLGDHRDALALAERLRRARVRASRAGEPVEGYDRMIAAAEERAHSRLAHLDDALKRVRTSSKALG